MTANPLALLLTGLAALGVLFTLLKLLDDWRNYQAIRRAIRLGRIVRGGGQHWIAIASLVSSSGQLLVWAGFCAIAAIILTMPGPAPTERAPGNSRILLTLIYMEAVLALLQVWQIGVRSRVRRPRVLVTMAVPSAAHQSLTEMRQAADETLGAAQKTVSAAEDAVDAIQDEHDRQREDRP